MMDLFLIVGQSNAQGWGDGTRSPVVPEGVGYDLSFGDIRPLRDPVGTARSGSAWPAFALAWRASTGGTAGIVNSAYGGSSLLELADRGFGNWSPRGDLRAAARSAARRTTPFLSEREIPVRWRGIIWAQGESDAGSGVAPDAYRDAFLELVDWLRTELPERSLPVFVITVGCESTGDTGGFAGIRAAQEEAARVGEDIHVVYRDCVRFPERGWMSDVVHYTQAAYDDIGAVSARAIAGILGTR